ncbi:MAG: hypothetical protein AB7P76_00145 [Candidatus Melainabacteria bacterium]
MTLKRLIPMLLLAGLLISPAFLAPEASALKIWPGKHAEEPGIENYEPLPPDDFSTRCEPIRQRVQDIYDKPAWIRGLYIPQRELWIARHRRCKKGVYTREYDYLKHVNIPNPSLEKLDDGDEATPAAPQNGETNP